MTAEGDFAGFYATQARAVFTTVHLLCGDRSVAEDAMQEAFARAWERWDRLQGETWAAGWVTSTAMNVARRSLRRRKAAEIRREEGNDADVIIDLWRQVRALPAAQQKAVILYYRADLPVEEIARIMGCREGTVRTHLARARQSLRRRLEGVLDADRRQNPATLWADSGRSPGSRPRFR